MWAKCAVSNVPSGLYNTSSLTSRLEGRSSNSPNKELDRDECASILPRPGNVANVPDNCLPSCIGDDDVLEERADCDPKEPYETCISVSSIIADNHNFGYILKLV